MRSSTESAKRKRITFDQIAEHAKGLTGIDVMSRVRSNENVRVRMAIANTLILAGYNTVETGRLLKKDHSTIFHYRNRHSERYMSDQAYEILFDELSAFANTPIVAGSDELIRLIRSISVQNL